MGLGWAAWNDYNRVDPNWKSDSCFKGIYYSLHQDEQDNWLICISNRYMNRLAVGFKVGNKSNYCILRQGERSCFRVEPGDNPSAEIEWVGFAPEGGEIEKITDCDND